MSDNTFVVQWRAEVTEERPITGFHGNVTVLVPSVDGKEPPEREVILFSTESSITTFMFPGFEKGRTYEVVICATNAIGMTCVSGTLVEPTVAKPTPDEVGVGRLSPGLIAGIVVVVVAVLSCCLLLLLLLLCCLCCRSDEGKAYYPGKESQA